jgi:Peptidase family M3
VSIFDCFSPTETLRVQLLELLFGVFQNTWHYQSLPWSHPQLLTRFRLFKSQLSKTVSVLDSWRKAAEDIEVAENRLYYKQRAGFSFDKRQLAAYEKRALDHSKKFLKSFGKEPRALFLMSVDAVGRAKTFKLHMMTYDARTSKIVSNKYRFQGCKVNWGSWRQFTAHTDDPKARKELFDEFLDKSKFLTPLIEERFNGYRDALSDYGIDPLTLYLETEKLGYDRLISFVETLGSALKPLFRESLEHYSKEILDGKNAEYYDDYYFFRSRVFRRYAEKLPTKYEPVQKILSTMKKMGLDASKVKVDDVNRKGKRPSAFCFPIKVPTDVRICYRKSNPLEDFSGVFHEFGHGIHGVSIMKNESFENKYLIAMGVAEVFSIFFENLLHDQIFLEEELGFSKNIASDIIRRFRFNELFFVTFYSANSTMKLRYWKEGLSMEQANSLYSDLIERYLGIRYPGKYWQLHHIMPEYFLYSPSYLIAAVRALELANLLRERYGERYWSEKNAGKDLLEYLSVGGGIDVSKFPRLDAERFAGGLKRRP